MLVVDVDVVGSGADRQRLLLQLLAVPADQLIAQLHVFGQAAGSNVAHLAQLDDIAFLLTIEWHENRNSARFQVNFTFPSLFQ